MARLAGIALLGVTMVSCAAAVIPSLGDVNELVLRIREYDAWAWAAGIVAIWADLVLPVPQTVVIAALGIVYGPVAGGLLGSAGLVSGGFIGYALARRFGRAPVTRLIGGDSLAAIEGWFERAGAWAIVLTRSLPYNLPEAAVVAAGLGGMPPGRFLLAVSLGSVPTAFVFSAIGAGWQVQPALALVLSYLLPIPLVPVVLHLVRRRPAPPTPSRRSRSS
jgi:uncharacterized membrane protein YdjX (TVP38/TMEM64 family)